MLEIRNIDLKVGGKALFKGDLYAKSGEVTMLWGPIGSGKTTLFKALFRQRLDVWLDGTQLSPSSDWYEQTAYVNQDVHLYDDFTFEELRACFCFDSAIGFADVAVTEEPSKKIKHCSEGEKQRIGLMVGLWKRPKILILDEPTSFLDRHNQDRILALIRNYTQAHHCVTLISSHHRYDQQFADSRYEIERKKLILKQDSLGQDQPIHLSPKSPRSLKALSKWVEKHAFYPLTVGMNLFLVGSLLLVLLTAHQIEQLKASFLSSQERYFLSFTATSDSQTIYSYDILLSLGEKKVPVSVINYYDEMNLFGQKGAEAKGVLVTDALAKGLGKDQVTINEHTFQIADTLKEGSNNDLLKSRYAIFVPDTLYPFKKQAAPLYEMIGYQSVAELEMLAAKTSKVAQFVNGNTPLKDILLLNEQLSSQRILLAGLPLVLGLVLLVLRIVLEKKYEIQLSFLTFNGMTGAQYRRFEIKWKALLFLWVLLIVLLPLFNSEIPLYAGLTFMLYGIMETKLSIRMKETIHV